MHASELIDLLQRKMQAEPGVYPARSQLSPAARAMHEHITVLAAKRKIEGVVLAARGPF